MANGYISKITLPDGNSYNIQDNVSGYITGISSSDVINALGYTPYDSTNPNGYITGYTETDPIFTASAAYGISSSDITNWDDIYDSYYSSKDISALPTESYSYNFRTSVAIASNDATLPQYSRGVFIATPDGIGGQLIAARRDAIYVAERSGSDGSWGNIINITGNLSSLSTRTKTSLVAAINNNRADIGDITNLSAGSNDDLVGAVNTAYSAAIWGSQTTATTTLYNCS